MANDTLVTLSKGGTAERTVRIDSLDVADLWNVAAYLDKKDMPGSANAVREVWHLAHDLKRHIQEG